MLFASILPWAAPLTLLYTLAKIKQVCLQRLCMAIYGACWCDPVLAILHDLETPHDLLVFMIEPAAAAAMLH